ncbi:MAG: C39 family peptidase [Tumebacillaceae bacterium]
MKRKLLFTLMLTIGCSSVAYAKYEPVREILSPALHSLDLKHNHGAVDSAVEQAASKSKDGSLEADDSAVKSVGKEVHTSQQPPVKTTAKPAEKSGSKSVQPAKKTATPAAKKTTTTSTPQPAPAQTATSNSFKLIVPAKLQGPELYNGCEVTSLSMLLSAAGHPVDKMTLANSIKKDPTPATYSGDNQITAWGDPNNGFVGDVTGSDPGYGVYHGPVAALLNSYLPGRAEDLTGGSFDRVLARIASGHPVIAWTTATFTPTSSWTTWQGPNGPVKATFDEHVVLIVGYNNSQIFINDPLDGTASKAVDRASFISAWQQLGNQAVTYKN